MGEHAVERGQDGGVTAQLDWKPGYAVLVDTPAETVELLDLGSGGGFDCFLAAKQVGSTGRVIGVDMTADMVTKARANAKKLEKS